MATLKSELTLDPATIGYAPMTDAEVVEAINDSVRPRNREAMSHREIAANINATEWDALSSMDQDRIIGVLGMGGDGIDPFGIATNVFVSVFGAGSATIISLAVARVEKISRATEIGLRRVRVGEVMEARSG